MQGTAEELARDLDLDPALLRYRCAGINHMAFYLSLEKNSPMAATPASIRSSTRAPRADKRAPKPNMHGNPRCQNIVRYEMFQKLGYFVTESSEHFCRIHPVVYQTGA